MFHTSLNSLKWVLPYYQMVIPYLRAYLEDRPVSIIQLLDGGGCYYVHRQADLPKTVSDCLPTRPDDLIICSDSKTLLNIVEAQVSTGRAMGLMLWPSRLETRESPDWLSWQLLPGEGVPFSLLCRASQKLVVLLEEKGHPVFVKTSDSFGLDIVIPAQGFSSYEEVSQWARNVAAQFAQQSSDRIKPLQTPEGHVAFGQIGIYTGGNQWGRGIIAPYSLTLGKQGAYSLPLKLEELASEVGASNTMIPRLKDRLDQTGNLWKNLL